MSTFAVSLKEPRMRLDHYLTERFPQWSRSHLKRLIDDGFVLVSGCQKKAGFLLRGGDTIEVRSRNPRPLRAEPEDIPVEVLYEDEALLIINKPAGLVVHPAAGHWSGTLVNALLFRVRELSRTGEPDSGDPYRPGIVHRLDKGTSGVMVVAKTDAVHCSLAGQFKHRKIKKLYHAVVFRHFVSRQGTIDTPMGRDPKHRLKFSGRASRMKTAVTDFRLIENGKGLALLELMPHTGRTHQIRVHLAESRHPIVGDRIYGAGAYLPSLKDETVRTLAEGMCRPALHAFSLGFTHPVSGQPVEFSAPWPEDFKKLARAICPSLFQANPPSAKS